MSSLSHDVSICDAATVTGGTTVQRSDSQQPRLNTCLFFLFVCFRSSDSDGAFETPESTTPVKTASPIEPQAPQLPSDDTGILLPPLIIHLLIIINSKRRIRRTTQRKGAKA